MIVPNAVVLLSGGLDSTAALCWATRRYIDVRAFGVDYGQPNRDAELTAARLACEALEVPYIGIHVADAMRPAKPAGLMGGVPAAGEFCGINRAFVPGRNLMLATVAASHACTWWPAAFDIIMGACAEDQGGFPDCKPTTLAQLGLALQLGCLRSIMIKTPWADKTKREILYACQPDAVGFDLVRRSWSCYQKSGPCGVCGACVNRAAAFEAMAVEDLCAAPRMFGGDPQRKTG